LRSRPWCPRRAYPRAAGDSEASSGRCWRLWQRWIALHGGGMRRWLFFPVCNDPVLTTDDTYRRGNSIPMLSCRTPSLLTLSRCSSWTCGLRLSSPPQFDTTPLRGPNASSRRRATTQAAVTMSRLRIGLRCAEGALDGGNGIGRPFCLHSLQVLTADGALLGPGSDRY
jgi:hypothetical protein